jgi:hypothetical protein
VAKLEYDLTVVMRSVKTCDRLCLTDLSEFVTFSKRASANVTSENHNAGKLALLISYAPSLNQCRTRHIMRPMSEGVRT